MKTSEISLQYGKNKNWLKMLVRLEVLLFFIVNLKNISTQFQTPAQEMEVCEQYKKQLFEVKETFGFFVRDAPIMTTTVDKCFSYEPFVVGGSPATPKEFPPMARIGHHENNITTWFCGGTLISRKYVLTAAHCFYSYDPVDRVRLGELDFRRSNENANPEDYGVVNLIKHPDYNNDGSLYNDIGLIELDRNVIFDSYKHPACLPLTNGNEFYDLIAIGWGNTHFAGVPSDHLLKVKLNRFDDVECEQIAKSVDTKTLSNGLNINSQICAGSGIVRDTCSGDSGGPLLAYHPKYPCLYYVIGITSFGIESCGRPNVPGIYTRVNYYLDWIVNYIF